MAFLLISFVAMADPESAPRNANPPFTTQSLWYTKLDKYAGRWIDAEGKFEAIMNGQEFSLKTKGVWPELEKPLLLSPQMEFFAGEHLHELWLGDYPEPWILLLRFANLGGSKQECPEFRVFQKESGAEGRHDVKNLNSKFIADSNIGWRLRLLTSSGEWESEDGSIQMNINYRTITFPRSSTWPELKGINYLAGSTRSFQVAGFRFDLQCPNDDLNRIEIFRKNLADSSLQSKKFKPKSKK